MHPYKSLPARAFWRSSVANVNYLALSGLYTKKFPITPTDRIVTAGSCFAQHIARRLAQSGFNYVDHEPAPPFLPADQHKKFGYGVYSARYANIYTARQLLQTFQRAFGGFSPADDVWETNGRFHDAFRPTIEPGGFESREELEASRETHLAAVRKVFRRSDLFIFTLGLTEAWRSRADGAAYPLCPGTVAGTFDPACYEFHNFTFAEIHADMKSVMLRARHFNPSLRFLLTVSPVPLTATASTDHVLVATTYSKSVLRAVAGQLEQEYDFVDYFPSYELVAAHPGRAMLYEPNLREVNGNGVDIVMRHFFAEHEPLSKEPAAARKPAPQRWPHRTADDVVCEEMLLGAAE